VGVVDQPIADGIGDGGVGDQLVPVIGSQLAGDQGGAQPVSVFEELQEIVLLIDAKALEPPVIEHDEIGAGDGFQQAGVAAVALGEAQILQQPGQAEVKRSIAFPTGLVASAQAR
jgi:hypothetical protein